MSKFEMKIEEVFAFQDGRTIFAGEIIEGDNFVERTECVIEIDGTRSLEIVVDGEMINTGQSQNEIRSVSTTDAITCPLDDLRGAVIRSL